jgi:hypothetical protein
MFEAALNAKTTAHAEPHIVPDFRDAYPLMPASLRGDIFMGSTKWQLQALRRNKIVFEKGP